MYEKKWLASDEKTELRPFDKVLVRDNEDQVWAASWFSYYDSEDSSLPFNAAGTGWRYCIPYKGNEHLAGTKTPILKPRRAAAQFFAWGERVLVWDSVLDRKKHTAVFCEYDSDEGLYYALVKGDAAATGWTFCERA